MQHFPIKSHATLTGLTGLAMAAVALAGIGETDAYAQICGPAYTVQPQTVLERQLEQRLKVVYDTVMVEQEMVTQRPVRKVRYETRQFTVRKPVVETSTVEERYTVRKPVTTRHWIDRSYDETTFVTETSEREESYTTYRPVTETTYQTRNYTVQRPVTETQYQTQNYTTYRPQTSYQNAVVDQGQYVAQQFYQPGDTRYGLRWQRGGYYADPYYGVGYRRGGFGWVPYTSPGNTFAQLYYQPNPVQVSVPQTTMVPQLEQRQVPVQVTRMESQVVQEQVPVSQTRMEAVQQTRRVPYAVQKPVTRRVTKYEPVDRTEYVTQEMVRPKTITRNSYKLETETREVPIEYYETEEVRTMVKVPRRVARFEPYTVEKLVPRTVHSPVVLSYYDPYSDALQYQSSFVTPATSETVTYGAGKPVTPEISSDTLPDGDEGGSVLRQKTVFPEVEGSEDESAEAEPLGLSGPDGT